MMTYALSSRFWNVFWLIVTLIPSLSIGSHLLAETISGRLGDEPTGRLVGSAIALIGFLSANVLIAWRIHEVRISGSGWIEIARTITTTAFNASQIRQLEGKYHRGYDDEQEWKLHITWSDGKASVDEFHNVMDFVGRIESLNPTVKITGMWPMGPPEPQPRAGGVLP